MRHTFLMTALFISLVTLSGCGQPNQPIPSTVEPTPLSSPSTKASGEALFSQHCAGCHMLQDPSTQALYKQSAALTSPENLITLVRNPAPRPMPAFDETTLPDADVETLQGWLVKQVKLQPVKP